MAGKVKKYTTKVHFPGGGEVGSGVRDMARPCLEIYELSSLKRHSLILTPILGKSTIVIFRQ